MIVIENIELYKSDKTTLKHLSIDKDTPLSEWMIKGAQYILSNDPDIPITPIDDYATYTMNISDDLNKEIRMYVANKEVKIRDFWIKVSKTLK